MSTTFENIEALFGPLPEDSIVSRTLHKDPTLKLVLFGFAAGQSLSEHSAAQTAVIHLLKGEADLTVGDQRYEGVGAGFMTIMPPHLKHSVFARTPLIMLLTMVTPAP